MAVRVKRVLSFVLAAVVFQCYQVQIASAVACAVDAQNKCKCKLADNSGEIDLSPLFTGGKLSVQGTGQDAGYTFTYDACNPVPCNNKCESEGGCAGCQSDGSANVFGIGNMNSAQFGEVSTSGWTFKMTYSNGDKTSHVAYTYAAGSSSLAFNGESSKNVYELAVTGCFTTPTTNCGATPSPSGGGGVEAGWVGFVLITLVIIAVVLYFAIGMPIMYFVKGARGVEMIPLITFWKDFPFLLKDGFMFTIFGWPCCANMRPQAYSKI